ncbi:DUF4097 family beta strand repeat protein [Candidatus Dependentiae bacterium]|nr:DUF4097 family beta strand repeat protein [Candidatus Dependentiae bacterium]
MSEEQLRILKLVEDGKITASQAADLLSAIKSSERRDSVQDLKSRIRDDVKQRVHKVKILKRQQKDEKRRMKDEKRRMKDEQRRMKRGKSRTDDELIKQELEMDEVGKELGQEIRENIMDNLFTFVSEIPKMVKSSMSFGREIEAQELEFENKDSVKLRLVSGDLILETSPDDKIRMTCESFLPIDKELDKDDGDLSFSFTYSDVRLALPRGLKSLKVDIVSGDVVGSYEVETSAISSISGDIVLTVTAYNNLSLKTKSGDIKVKLPKYDNTSVFAKTLSGDIRVKGLDTGKKQKRNHFEFTPKGEVKNTVSSSSLAGDVLLDFIIDKEIEDEG